MCSSWPPRSKMLAARICLPSLWPSLTTIAPAVGVCLGTESGDRQGRALALGSRVQASPAALPHSAPNVWADCFTLCSIYVDTCKVPWHRWNRMTQSGDPGPAAAASPEHAFKMQILRLQTQTETTGVELSMCGLTGSRGFICRWSLRNTAQVGGLSSVHPCLQLTAWHVVGAY